MSEYYTYTYFIDGIPSYVGHGKGKTCLRHKTMYSGMLWHRHLRKKINEGATVKIKVTPRASKEVAQDEEYYLIKYYGLRRLGEGTLYNHNNGRKPQQKR